jgi:hypothetical protein
MGFLSNKKGDAGQTPCEAVDDIEGFISNRCRKSANQGKWNGDPSALGVRAEESDIHLGVLRKFGQGSADFPPREIS